MQRTDGEQHIVSAAKPATAAAPGPPGRAAGGRRALVALLGTRYGERNGAAVELAPLLDAERRQPAR